MNTNHYHKLILTAAATLGLAAAAFAADDAPMAPLTSASSLGLLGHEYASLTYRYVDLDSPATHADNYRFEVNEALRDGFDGVLGFDWTDGAATKQKSISTGLRAYSAGLAWGKPFAEARAGYVWQKTAGLTDDSFLWSLAVGAEFQAAPAVTVSPYVQFADAPSIHGNGRWEFGVKANYWLDHQWAVTVGLDRDDHQNTGFMVGTNFRF